MATETELKIIGMALKLMEIEYTNWNTCLEHCSSIRGDRHSLNYYVKKIKKEIEDTPTRKRVESILNDHLDRIDGLTVTQSLENALDEIYK